MKKIVKWYRSKNKGIRVCICVVFVWALLFANIQGNRFILSSCNRDTPEGAIRYEVLKKWGREGHIYEHLYKAFVLEVEEVSEKEAETPWYSIDGYDRKTQKVYRITKNCPNTLGGYWIVTKIYHNQNHQYYSASYAGI